MKCTTENMIISTYIKTKPFQLCSCSSLCCICWVSLSCCYRCSCACVTNLSNCIYGQEYGIGVSLGLGPCPWVSGWISSLGGEYKMGGDWNRTHRNNSHAVTIGCLSPQVLGPVLELPGASLAASAVRGLVRRYSFRKSRCYPCPSWLPH